MEDKDILDLFFARNEEALVETMNKFGNRLFHSAMNVLHNTEDADECVNDTLLKAWEAIPPTRPTSFGAFLAKITRNLSINKWKAQSAKRRGGTRVDLLLSELEEVIPHSKLGVPEKEYESQNTSQAINEFLETVDKTARVAFVLRYFHGESIQGICQRLKISESKAKSLLFRTRKKLRTHLEKEGVLI